MGDLTDALAFIVICIVGLALILGIVVGVAVVGGRFIAGVTLGQEYQTMGYIRFYEQSSWIAPHTIVILETHGGTEAKFALIGYHDFDLSGAYQINTVCRRGGLWGMDNWYEVTNIEELS